MNVMHQAKSNILLVGCGGIGTIAALNLERGDKAVVTAVLRSNYEHVEKHGFHIRSIDHGTVEGYKPTIIRSSIPNVKEENLKPYDYIVCATKNIPDVPPGLTEIISPAVTPGLSAIVLIQNGLNIEQSIMTAFPTNPVLSGVSFCGSHQVAPGEIVHGYPDELYVGAFRNLTLDAAFEDGLARDFCHLYGAGGKCIVGFDPDVGWSRWRKLLYNACLNPICAITDLDTGRIQLADGVVGGMVRPAMEEIRAAAKACGHDWSADLVDSMITMDPVTLYNTPSMQDDVRKGRFTELENLIGAPLREGTARGVPMPMISMLYQILKAIQWRTRERKGMVSIPAADHDTL